MKATILNNTNNDLMVANVARVSFDKWNTALDLSLSSTGKQRDPNLIKYLAEHRHLSPFFHIRFTMEFPSTEAIPLYAITDPTYLMGAVWSNGNGKFKFRTSYYGWMRLLRDNLIHPDYRDGVITPLINNDELRYCNQAYNLVNLVSNDTTEDNFLFTEEETDYNFIDVSMRLEVPIFIARQLFTHRMFVSNEVSRRYVNTPPTYHTPVGLRKRPDGSIKQGSINEYVTHLHCLTKEEDNERIFSALDPETDTTDTLLVGKQVTLLADTIYQSMVFNRIAPEQARMYLPQSMITSFVFTGSLTSWSRLIAERTYQGAQLEVQEVALQALQQIQSQYPSFS